MIQNEKPSEADLGSAPLNEKREAISYDSQEFTQNKKNAFLINPEPRTSKGSRESLFALKDKLKNLGCRYSKAVPYKGTICPVYSKEIVEKFLTSEGVGFSFLKIYDVYWEKSEHSQKVDRIWDRIVQEEEYLEKERETINIDEIRLDKEIRTRGLDEGTPMMLEKQAALEARKKIYAESREEIDRCRNAARLHEENNETKSSSPELKKEPVRILKSVGVGEFIKMTLKQKPMILAPILREQDIQLIYAHAGIGKTHVALNMAYAIATGGMFLNLNSPTPRHVLYIDGEMPEIQLQERLADIFYQNGEKDALLHNNLQLLISTSQENGLPYLDTKDGQACLQPFFEKAEVIFLDNLSVLTAIAEQDAASWVPIQELLIRLRRQGKTIILIHHAGKNGDFRGTSRAIGIVDTVINLRRPAGYEMHEGLHFELHFQKARGVFGDAVNSLDIRAEEKNGSLQWTYSKLEESLDIRIKEMIALEMKDADIITDLGISRATYYRHKKKLKT